MSVINFIDENGSFSMKNPGDYSYLYFPIAGEGGIKSSITPDLGGDIKLDQNSFLLEPVSVMNLHNNRSVRNFWCMVDGKGAWSCVGASAEQEFYKFTKDKEESSVEAGFMWHELGRESKKYGLKSKVLSFVPTDNNVEIMSVTLENITGEDIDITPVAAVPIYGRSADNIRDHRHVTSLLHRIYTSSYGVIVKPTLSFDERGHKKNNRNYYVCGVEGNGNCPVSFYPTIEQFIGEGGSLINPKSIINDEEGVPSGYYTQGKEALGGIRFEKVKLKPAQTKSFIVILGISDNKDEIDNIIKEYDSIDKVISAKEKTAKYWINQVNVSYKTGSPEFDGFMKWVSFQPFLRRLYGCSFLPHHDYGRGGRGWRDLWQDCLSLLIMDPSGVRKMILDNYGGVRVDGTNATIIGTNPGEFIADRNGIARVWMDHGVWPFMTTKLYINQTGDLSILSEKASYFKDEQKERGTNLDREWNVEYGVCQRTFQNDVYKGTILEHILLEHLCSFYEVGEHNHIKLRGADWNDALDMASTNGESVAFTCAYAGNMNDLADLLEKAYYEFEVKEVNLLKEIEILLADNVDLYDSVSKKNELLNDYLKVCGHDISGETILVNTLDLANNLRSKADWIMKHVRNTEWICEKDEEEGWFNSYYDDNKKKVEGYFENEVRMMLTGQVFSIMSKSATTEQVKLICKAADKYLYRESLGGYRLNTDFHEEKLDLGRMFGFAYGEKENGAVFSHMAVMYANALYQRGFVREGYKALQALANQSMCFDRSKIYPGIPEYFDGSGRGLYHYLTGAASWYMLTFITEVFGVKGEYGNLVVEPKLVKEQFDEAGKAALNIYFANKHFDIEIINQKKLDYGAYSLVSASCNNVCMDIIDGKAILNKNIIDNLSDDINTIKIELN